MDGKCASRKGAGDDGEVNPDTKHDAHDISSRTAKESRRPAAMPSCFVVMVGERDEHETIRRPLQATVPDGRPDGNLDSLD